MQETVGVANGRRRSFEDEGGRETGECERPESAVYFRVQQPHWFFLLVFVL